MIRQTIYSSLITIEKVAKAIPQRVYNFFGALAMYIFFFHWINSDIEEGNFMQAMFVVGGDFVVGLMAIQNLPRMFFEMFDEAK
jgi:hypothetical protein